MDHSEWGTLPLNIICTVCHCAVWPFVMGFCLPFYSIFCYYPWCQPYLMPLLCDLSVWSFQKVPLSISNVGFVPIYGSDLKHKVLALFTPEDQFTGIPFNSRRTTSDFFNPQICWSYNDVPTCLSLNPIKINVPPCKTQRSHKLYCCFSSPSRPFLQL